MKRSTIVLIALSGLACATARQDPGSVRVLETSAVQDEESRRLPEGCQLLESWPPFDQQESERAADDPYRARRRETEARGGNVLLVISQRTVSRPNPECPKSDRSPDCLGRSVDWFRVTLQAYRCSPEALAALPDPSVRKTGQQAKQADAPKPAFVAAPPAPRVAGPAAAARTLSPPELKDRVLGLMREGVGRELLLTYVGGAPLAGRLTAEDIVDWKRAGIDEEIIRAAAAK